jgi:glyoxylase-like metal-dependent hydrolase (beta-lactamase superfamily II)
MVHEIDTRHLGNDRVIAAHQRDDVIVDPGPASALDNWLDELAEPPRALLLTHIHLDHAGATGVLVRRYPHLRVYVSEVGAPHLIDPERLLRSAGRLYGPENMRTLWGEVAPVPAANVVALAGGEEVEGMRVEHTPGHAGHHVCYFDLEHGDAFVGDMAGVRVPPAELTVAPTPPPEIDVKAWLESIDRIEAMAPARLRLTHFGAADEPGLQLDRTRAALRRAIEAARGGRDGFLAAFERQLERTTDAETAERVRQATPPEQQWLGLERYLARHKA